MLIACALWHETAKGMQTEDTLRLAEKVIEGALFDYLYRLVITDIKPPVFYKIRQNPIHFRQLTERALKTLAPVLTPLPELWKRFQAWHFDQEGDNSLERRILAAAHLYASSWEFKLIKPMNFFDEEMDSIAADFDNALANLADLPGMRHLLDEKRALSRFGNLCGQLRFQIRWTQTPRMPATSVLGHMFIVAVCAYFFSLSINLERPHKIANFFSALFHDFPEVMTRDIISPVKQSFPELPKLIKDYENEELERRVLGPLRKDGLTELSELFRNYLGMNREIQTDFSKNDLTNSAIETLQSQKDKGMFYPEAESAILLKICDLLGAFLEAHNSILNGASSPQLVEGRARIKREILSMAPECFHIDALLADFD